MSKYKFTQTDTSNPFGKGSKTTKTIEEDSLGQILPAFKEFLLGCGFVIDGELDVVSDEELINKWEDEPEEDYAHNQDPKPEWSSDDLSWTPPINMDREPDERTTAPRVPLDPNVKPV